MQRVQDPSLSGHVINRRDGIVYRDHHEHIRGLKGHQSIAQALAWVCYSNESALKGRQKSCYETLCQVTRFTIGARHHQEGWNSLSRPSMPCVSETHLSGPHLQYYLLVDRLTGFPMPHSVTRFLPPLQGGIR